MRILFSLSLGKSSLGGYECCKINIAILQTPPSIWSFKRNSHLRNMFRYNRAEYNVVYRTRICTHDRLDFYAIVEGRDGMVHSSFIVILTKTANNFEMYIILYFVAHNHPPVLHDFRLRKCQSVQSISENSVYRQCSVCSA